MENRLAKVSVIITTYNREIPILKRAVDSVINQTYSNIELVIVNDAPENLSLSANIQMLVDNYRDHRLTYVELEHNSGACAARNVGIRYTDGEFIAFLDDDDEYVTDKIESQLPLFINDNIGMVSCLKMNYYADGRITTSPIEYNCLRSSFSQILNSNYVGTTSMPIIRRICFEKCGLFDESFPSAQDWDMWIRIMKVYNVAFYDKALLKYYISEDGITANFNKRLKGWDMILNKYSDDYKKYKREYNSFLNLIARELIRNYRKKEALLYYRQALKVMPLSFRNLELLTRFIVK